MDKAYFVLILGFVSLTIVTIKIISGTAPVNFSQNTITMTIFSLDIILTALLFLTMPQAGAVGDERTKRAAEKAGLYAFLILVGSLLILSGAGYMGGLDGLSGIDGYLVAARSYPWMPFTLAHIGIYSWVIMAYYFVKKGDVY